MGIPQSDTVRTGSVIGWQLGGQDHISTGVVKQRLPVVDAEDGQLWDAQKYERQELAKMLFSDGVLLGDVWRDGVNRNSFKVEYAFGNLTVYPGRCIIFGKRVDLGLGVSFDSGLVTPFVLAGGGQEKIIYLDVFERKITPPPAFAPAGDGMDISVYADFSVYNTADAAVKEATVAVGGPLPVPAAGHHFLEIARVSSIGAVTDSRVMSYLMDPQKPNMRGFCVSNAADAVIGRNCTHLTIDAAIADLSSPMIGAVETARKFIFVAGGAYTVSTPGLTIPANVNILAADPQQRRVDTQGFQSSGFIIPGYSDYGWTANALPSIDFAVAVAGAFQSATNLQISSTTANINTIAAIYVGCKVYSSGVAAALTGYFYDCEIGVYGVVGFMVLEQCRWVFNQAFQVTATTGNIYVNRSALQLTQTFPVLNNFSFLTISSGAIFTMKFSSIEYQDGNASSNNKIINVTDGLINFYHSHFRCYGLNCSPSSRLINISGPGAGINVLSHCTFLTEGPEVLFYSDKTNLSHNVLDSCSFKSGCSSSPQPVIVIDVVTNGASGSLQDLFNVVIESDYAKCMTIIGANPQIGTLDVYMSGCRFVINQSLTNNVFEHIISDSGNYSFSAYGCTFVHKQNLRAMKMAWTAPFATITTKFFNCVFSVPVGGNAVDTNINLNVVNSTYTGAILGGGTFNAQTAGAGANASNAQV